MVATHNTPTAEELALLPSDEDVAFYAEHGWYLSKKLLTDSEVDTLLTASEAFYAGRRDRWLPARPPNLAYWQPSDGDVQRHNDYIHYESAAIGQILRKPLIGAVAARLAGASSIRMFQSTLIYKPPRPNEPSNLVPWHFDSHYWATCTSGSMLTAFIPFHNCDEPMGTITMVDGSHTWKESGGDDTTVRHFADRDRGDLDRLLERNADYNNAELRKIPMLIERGRMSFHHCRIYHGSGPNRSGQPRRAISLHLQDGDNQHRGYSLSDGTPVRYNHDYLVRQTPEGTPDYADPEYCPIIWQS